MWQFWICYVSMSGEMEMGRFHALEIREAPLKGTQLCIIVLLRASLIPGLKICFLFLYK